MKVSEKTVFLVMTMTDGEKPGWVGTYDNPTDATEAAIDAVQAANDPDLIAVVSECRAFQGIGE